MYTKKFKQKNKGRQRQGAVINDTKALKSVDTFNNLNMIPIPLQNCSFFFFEREVAENWTNIAKQTSS